MKVNRLSPDIYEIENFITDEEQESVLKYAKSLDESEWWSENMKDTFFYGKQKYGILPGIIFDSINKKVKSLCSNIDDVGKVALQRYKTSEFMGYHKDYWIKDVDFYIRYGIVIYYNDDYVGGEIEYPEVGIVHKPKAKSLVMHGGNISHGTLEVKGDQFRYFSTAFIRGSVTNPVILNKNIFGDVELHDGSKYP